MYSRILNCDYEFVSPWWDDVSLNAKDLVSPGPGPKSGLVTLCGGIGLGPGPDPAACLQVSRLVVLDPQKRLSVREALQHPWVLGKAARFSHMDTTQRKLQEFNARRKLKVSLASSLSLVTFC